MTVAITSEEYLKLGDRARAHKFRNIPVVTEEGRFDSTGEYGRWCELKLLRDAGEIANLQRQVVYALWVGDVHVCDYRADFTYAEPNREGLFPQYPSELVVEDYKGVRTEGYRLKKRLMLACFGITIKETGARDKVKPASGVGGRQDRERGRKGEKEEDGPARDGKKRRARGTTLRDKVGMVKGR